MNREHRAQNSCCINIVILFLAFLSYPTRHVEEEIIARHLVLPYISHVHQSSSSSRRFDSSINYIYLHSRDWRKVRGCNAIKSETTYHYFSTRGMSDSGILYSTVAAWSPFFVNWFVFFSINYFVLSAHRVLLSIFDGDLKRGKNGLTLMKMSVPCIVACCIKYGGFVRASHSWIYILILSVITFFPSHSNIFNWLAYRSNCFQINLMK